MFCKHYAQPYTELGLKVVPRLRECCRQVQAEVVSKSIKKAFSQMK